MKNNIIFSLILFVMITSCRYVDSEVLVDEPKAVKDSIDNTIVRDKDKDGCTASAGYIWSKINKECIKMFSGLQLTPAEDQTNEDETVCAYVLFSEDTTQAEIFMPNADQSILLNVNEKGKSWTNNDWKLLKNNGFELIRDNAIIFKGDAEIGKKFTQTDNEQ